MPRLRVALSLTVLTVSLLLAGPSLADSLTAEDFAADCNADGTLIVAADLTIEGGEGDITRDCILDMAADVELVIRNARLESTGSLIVGNALNGSRLSAAGSVITAEGALQLSPGCCAGGGEGDRSEANALVSITDSLLSGTSVEVTASGADSGGKVILRNSTLRSTASLSPIEAVHIGTGDNGIVNVVLSRFLSESGTYIRNSDGETTVTANLFLGGPARVSSRGGSCSSTGNLPPVACS